MIAWAPITRITDWITTTQAQRDAWLGKPSGFGEEVLRYAVLEKGKGESESNNNGPDLRRYRRHGGGRPGGAWCATFVGYCKRMAEVNLVRSIGVKPSPHARTLFRGIVKVGQLVDVSDIQAGDIVLWARGKEGSGSGHIGIVSRVEVVKGILVWHYIAGNEGKFPSKVREEPGHTRTRRIGFARFPR